MAVEQNPAVVVVGGGLAGLAAALHLAEKGLKPLLLEANPDFAGGRVAGRPPTRLRDETGREWLFPAEHGIHGLWGQYHNLKEMLKRNNILPRLVKADRQEWVHGQNGKIRRAEMGRIVRRTFWPAPFHYGALFFRPSFIRMLGFRDYLAIPQVLSSLLVAVSIDPMAESGPLAGRTLADFCRGWSPALRAFVATLARSGLSAHPEQVPMAGFIAFLRFYTVLRRDSQAFEYFPADPDSILIKPLIKRIEELGGEVRLGCRATRFEKIKEGWRLHYLDNSKPSPPLSISTPYLVLALDAPGTAQLLAVSPETRELAAGLHWPTGLETAVIRLWFSGTPPRRSEAGLVSGDFIIDNFFWLHRFQDCFKQWSNSTGGGAVESHIYGPAEVLAQPDLILLERASRDLENIFPSLRGKVLQATFQRNPPTHTLFSPGALSQHLGVRTPWPGLFCCGDWVRHLNGSLFLERAVVTGIEASNAVLEAESKPGFKLISPRRPEPLARLSQLILRGIAGSLSRGGKPSRV